MNRQVTQLELFLICLLCVAGVFLTLTCTGCTTAPTYRRYEVKAFTVVVADHVFIQKLWEESGKKQMAEGFFDYDSRTAYVPPSMANEEWPNFFVLGHEVYHLPELGGMFHD